MKNILFTALSLCGFVSSINAQDNRGRLDSALLPRLKMHEEVEYNRDVPVDTATWQTQQPGLHVSVEATDNVYFRTEVPRISKTTHAVESTGWRGERLNAMIVLWSADTAGQVRFVLQDLKTENGAVLSKQNLKLNMIRYVVSNYPYNANDVTCGPGPTDKAYLLPDRFESFDRFDLPARSVRPVWFTVDVPRNAVPGLYKGELMVKSDKGDATIKVNINVQPQVLLHPSQWSFQLDLWQNPTVIARHFNVDAWTDEHKTLLKKHLMLYAGAGGKFITTYAVHSPWADNSYTEEEGMIEWIKRKDNSWKFDYGIFDQYVQLAMDAGIDKAITVYTPIPWGERFRYLDEATGQYQYERWLPTSEAFKSNWNVFLTDLKAHLQAKGWLSKTYLGINENAIEQTLAAIKVIKEHSKDWKITYAGDWHKELDGLLDDYSCVYGKEPGFNEVSRRKANQQTTTYYICCTPPKPNTFVFSPPVEGRWLGWYALAHGYNGLLRWAYDAWPADPARDARHVLWPAGDCFMIYPGGSSSIRFEKMREGISDFEKIKILRAKAGLTQDPVVKELMKRLEQHLQTFNAEKTFEEQKLRNDLKEGQQLVDRLSERLK